MRSDVMTYSLELNAIERVLRERFQSWLPDTIIDAHAHCNLGEHVLYREQKMFGHMMTTFPEYSLADSVASHEQFFPGITVRSLRFPQVFRGIDIKAANAYLLRQSPLTDRVALLGIPTDVDYTIRMLAHPRVSALKMYYIFFDPPAQTILQVFPVDVLAVAQEREIPIILHLPRVITRSLGDLLALLESFPRLRVVLAHLGLPHLPVPGLEEAYQRAAAHPNVFMDTAMIPSWEVVALALSTFGPSRLMFGSDEPLHMIRSQVYEHPELGQRLITEYPYHWVDHEEHTRFKHLLHNPVHTLWQALEAIQVALEKMGTRKEADKAKNAIFFENALEIYGF
jgi:hypothetical protein